MVRLRRIGDVVPEDACVVEDARLDPLLPLVIVFGAPPPPLGDDPLVDFDDAVRQQAAVALRLVEPGVIERLQETESVGRVQSPLWDVVQMDVVVVAPGLVHLPEVEVAPAIGFGVEVDQLVRGASEECGHGGGQHARSVPSRHLVTDRPPARWRGVIGGAAGEQCGYGEPSVEHRASPGCARSESCWRYVSAPSCVRSARRSPWPSSRLWPGKYWKMLSSSATGRTENESRRRCGA